MKLSRKLVIQKLEERIVSIEAKSEKEDTSLAQALERQSAKVLRVMRAVTYVPGKPYQRLVKEQEKLHNIERQIARNKDDRNYYARQRNGFVNSLRAEIRLLNLSEDEHVSVRTNSDLGRILSET